MILQKFPKEFERKMWETLAHSIDVPDIHLKSIDKEFR